MTSYYLTNYAERETEKFLETQSRLWGHDRAYDYGLGLKNAFGRIGTGIIGHSIYSKLIPGLFVTKYRSHFIFFVE